MQPHQSAGREPLLGWRSFLVAQLVVLAISGLSRGVDSLPERPGNDAKAAHRAIEPAAPILPGEVVSALQEGRYPLAETHLLRLLNEEKDPAKKAYDALILGIAQRLGGKHDAARETLSKVLKAAPKGPWAAKLRIELAGLELAAGRIAEAEGLARTEAENLLSGDRKDRLAEVYHDFANRLLKPNDPVTPPDPKGAYELLLQARNLAKSEDSRARFLFALIRAAIDAKDYGKAINDAQSYLSEYPKGAQRDETRYLLGESQRALAQLLPARLTWSDLARDIAASKPKPSREADEIRARCLAAIPSTYGIPNPPDDTSLNLGIAAIRRFLADYPAHPKAVLAAYQIGASYLARSKSEEVREAFTSFLKGDGFRPETEEAKRELALLRMSATIQIGVMLRSQGKFDESIAVLKGYLASYPNGPQSAEAQQMILECQLLIAGTHRDRERYDEARSAWLAFVAQNPLDGRVSGILYSVGASFESQSKYDQAIAAWEQLLSKFPSSEPAAHAQFSIASIFENEKGDPETAIERFKKVNVEPWVSQARQRIAVMEAKSLTVVTPRAFRSGEVAHLEVSTRNLEKLTFSAYKLNAEAYFRKKLQLEEVESLDIGLVAPDAEWTVTVPGYAKYKPIESKYELPKLEIPGVYVVKVSDEKNLQATTLVLGSDVDAIVKSSRDQILVFAQNMKTGKGIPGARVLVAAGDEVILEAKTGNDGVLLKAWDKPREGGSNLQYLILDGPNVAGSDMSLEDTVAQGLSARAYIYTDRPAYRPGQQVAIRGVVREVSESQYANVPGATYKLEVTDSRGRLIVARPITLSVFGTFNTTVPLDSGAPVGTYRVRLYQPGKSDFAGSFDVQSYQLQKMDLDFDLKKTVYFRGETVTGDLVAKYQYGAPAAGRPVVVNLPDGRALHGVTDASGKFHVEFPTEGFAEEQTLRLAAQLPQDGVSAVANVALAIRAFSIDVNTTRDVYLDGESFQVQVTTTDAQGEPSGEALTVALLKRVSRAGEFSEREFARKDLKTDGKTGRGQVSLKSEDDEGGNYVIRVSGTDRFGNPIVADRSLTISGKKDDTKLRLLADRQTYKVGEEASVNLHSRGRPTTALLTWEADRIISYRIVTLAEGDNAVAWAVDGAQFPNFTLTASRMDGKEFDEARLDLRVERDLRVTITPSKPITKPGEVIEYEVTTIDQLGRPVAAEVSVALVDMSLLRLFNDKLPPIGPFFYNQLRVGAFETSSSNTFTYEPTTTPVAEAVVEEAERMLAQQANQAGRANVTEQAKGQVAMAIPAPASAPAAFDDAAGQMMGNAPAKPQLRGMMGGMGGDGRDHSKDRKRDQAMAGLLPSGSPNSAMQGEPQLAFSENDTKGEKEKLGSKRRAYGKAIELRAGEVDKLSPREQFVETAYWNPSVVTGKDGKSRVKFRAPMALSEYRFTARGVTGADTLVGQTTSGLSVRKDFFVDLKVPSVLMEGDRPKFIGRIHHVGVTGVATIKLSAYAGGREVVFPKTLDLKVDGIDEVLFDSFDVPDCENVRLTLSATIGEAKDELVVEVPVRPWGVQSFGSASGTASDDAAVFVGLPTGRTYERPEMLIVVSPSLQRMLIELAVGRDFYTFSGNFELRQGGNPTSALAYGSFDARIFPPSQNTTADRASDLLAATSVLTYLRNARGVPVAPEATRLTERIQGLVSELIASQNQDGGWRWIGNTPLVHNAAGESDRLTSARVMWALSTAEPLGLLADPAVLDRATAYLTQEYSRIAAGDHDARAMLLHALSTRGKANFENANSLNRIRQSLSDAALAYLALTFVNLDRIPLAGETLALLALRGKTEQGTPGSRPRRYWGGAGSSAWTRSTTETTALVALAFGQARLQAGELDGAIDWLQTHRQGFGWQPHKAKGPAVAALSTYYSKAQGADDRYRLVVTVNEREVYRTEVAGATEGKALLVPREALKAGDKNRVRFNVEGRGTFGYSVTMSGFTRDFGPDQTRTNRTAVIDRRVYFPADPELDGKRLATGFGVAVNPTYFENFVSQAAVGGRARVQITASRVQRVNQPEWERDFLVVEEHLPAGTTLIEGSVQTSASSYTLADGLLSFYFAPNQWPGQIHYDVYGYLPGQYRALPATIRSAYEPGRTHLGTTGQFRVLSPGEASSDSYKPTPDELYARGKTHFDAGRLAEAGPYLEELFNAYTLRDDIAKDAARMLLLLNIKDYNARKVVQYFEVVKEKAPELVITFDDLLVIGRAYRDINEFERAYLVWRGVTDASYLEDARIGEVLRQRGKSLEGIAYLLDLWREYPSSASIESDLFALAQLVAQNAGQAVTNPKLRRELAEAGVTRSELLLQSIRLIQVFLAQSPKNPIDDEASLALVGNFLELEDYPSVVKLSARFAKLYPKSTFLDSFQYSEALGEFHLGNYDRAVEVAQTIAKAIYKDAAGADQPSPNKWQAIYILGQIFDARRQPGKALEFYRQVAERFTDAALAVASYTHKSLTFPEVTVIRPPQAPKLVQRNNRAPKPITPAALRNDLEAPFEDRPEPKFPDHFKLGSRNIAEADVKVYPVDLMRLYLTRRNLDQISGIDLAGITPLVEKTIKLGTGEDYVDKFRTIDLGLTKEGAYLVMIRGENLYASGIVLVSPLELEILEEGSGRVRVTVMDSATRNFIPKVQVKVIGSRNTNFISGETDLRGVFTAEGINGEATAVARKGTAQYAFYRGRAALGTTPSLPPSTPGQNAAPNVPSLEENVRSLNGTNQMHQIERMEIRNKQNSMQRGAAAGGFR